MSDKVRKQEDRSTTLKSNRITTATIPLGGASPNLIPQPGTYQLPNDGGLPIPAPHHIAYGMMRPMASPLSMPGLPVKSQVQPTMSNDLGPPIFMPALNLGVPKHTTSTTVIPAPTKVKNNLAPQPTSIATAYDMGAAAAAAAMPLYPMQAYHTVPTVSTSVRVLQQHQQRFLPSQAVGAMKPSSPQSMSSQQLVTGKPTAVPATSVLTTANHKAAAASSSSSSSSSSSGFKQPSSGTVAQRASPGVKPSAGVKSPVSVPPPHMQHHSSLPAGKQQQMGGGTKPGIAQIKTENSVASTATTLQTGYSISPHSTINQTQMHPSTHYSSHLGGGVLSPTASSSPRVLPPSSLQPVTSHTSSLSQMLLSPSSPSSSSSSSSSSQQLPQAAVSRPQRETMVAEGSPLSASPAAHSPTLQGHIARLPGATSTATLTSSGQSTSTASFTDTRLERPPQPSSAVVAPQPLSSHNGTSKDRLTTAEVAQNMIITVPGLTGKRIAEMPGSFPPNSAPQGAVVVGENPLRGVKSELSQEDGWVSPNGHTMGSSPSVGGGGQLLNIQQQPSAVAKSGSSVVAAPGSPPPSSSSSSSSSSHSLPPPNNSSPRPRILRKRGPDGNWKVEGQPNVSGSPLMSKLPLSLRQKSGDGTPMQYPVSPGGDHTPNHLGGGARSGESTADFTASPRKKPRKQNVVGTEDQYASNVPDGLLLEGGGGGGGVGVEPAWGAVPEDKGFPAPPPLPPPSLNSITTRSTKIKTELPVKPEDGPKEVEMYYLSQLRRCPFPINGVYKLHHRVAHNHFRRHADIKHHEDERTSAFEIANNRSSWERMNGWKIHAFQPALDDVSQVESACLATMQRLQESLEGLPNSSPSPSPSPFPSTPSPSPSPSSSSSSSGEELQSLLEEFKELTQGNIDRSTRVISEIEGTRTAMLKVLDHTQQLSDVLKKYSTTKSCPSVLSSLTPHKTHS